MGRSELVEQGAAPLVLLAPGSEGSLQPLVVDCGSLVVISRRGIPRLERMGWLERCKVAAAPVRENSLNRFRASFSRPDPPLVSLVTIFRFFRRMSL